MKKETITYIKIPLKPKKFIFEEAKLIMTLENIKDFARDYNFTYALDCVNARVKFERKANDNNNQL